MNMDRGGGATAQKEPHPGELRISPAGSGVSFPVAVDGGAGVRADRWLICETAVERSPDGRRHGYVFEGQDDASNPAARVPIRAAGRMRHAAAFERSGTVFLTEDRGVEPDLRLGKAGGCLYRYSPGPRSAGVELADTRGRLEALAIRGEFHADMTASRRPGLPHPVTWVPVPDPDHGDDSDERTDRVPGFTPTRFQAQDNGAACFAWPANVWGDREVREKLYFECLASGPLGMRQVWIYDDARATLTLG